MKYTQQQFDTALNAYKRVDLTMSERKDLKARVLAQVAPQANMYRHTTAIKRVVGFGGLLFLSSATLAFGSQYSEPGDILYGLETEIVEPMIGAVIFDDREYQEYQTKLAMERIDEVLSLDSSDPTHTQHVAQAQDLFDRHVSLAFVHTENDSSREEYSQATSARMAMSADVIEEESVDKETSSVSELEILFALAVVVNDRARVEAFDVENVDELRAFASRLDIQLDAPSRYYSRDDLYADITGIVAQSQDLKGTEHSKVSGTLVGADLEDVQVAALGITSDALASPTALMSDATSSNEVLNLADEAEEEPIELIQQPVDIDIIPVLPTKNIRGL